MSEILMRLKQTTAVIVLIVVVVAFLNIMGDYRSAGDSSVDADSSVESTESASGSGDSTGTSEPSQPSEESLGTVTVIIDGLNFREEASASGQLIRGLSEGDVLEYLDGEEGWYHVRASDGVEGYVSASEQFTVLETP
jgi:hypothetical protein